MKRKMKTILLLAGGLWLGPVTAHAGLNDQEKALWGASAQAPTTFIVPVGQAAAVLDKAQSLIGNWGTMDRYMWPMPVRLRTAHLVQTDEPTALDGVGFKITDTETGGSAVISVDTLAFTGKVFQISQQHRNAEKRAHLLAYLLEQFAGVPTTPTPPEAALALTAQPAPAGSAPLPDPLETSLRQLHSLLAEGQYNAALTTLDNLRAAVAEKAKTAKTAGGK